MSAPPQRRRGEAIHLMQRVLRQFDARVLAALQSRPGFEAVRPSYLVVFRNMNPHGSRITDIARRAGLTKQAIGLLVKDMAAAGLVEVTTDPSDARARLVRIPQAGWHRHEQVIEIVTELLRDLERRIGRQGMDSLVTLLRQLGDDEPGGLARAAARRAPPA